jgi:Cu-processing system permease protein
VRACRIIAVQEIRDGFRNKWILAAALLLAVFAVSIAYLGSAPVGTVGAPPLAVSIVSLSSLTVFLLPLLGLMLSYDTVVGEAERGTLSLLLSYPLRRWQFLAGKFVGQTLIIAVAVLVGYGSAALLLAAEGGWDESAHLGAYGLMMASSVALGAAFVAIGYLISTLVAERGTAAGLALGVWLGFVLIYDAALLGLVVGDESGLIGDQLFNALLVLNPTDAYRMLNLTAFSEVTKYAGLGGVSAAGKAAPAQSALSLCLWVLLPLLAAGAVFSRKEI